MAKLVVITGASRGLGYATADRLAAAGVAVIGVARTEPEQGFPGEFISGDLSLEEERDGLFRDLATRYEIDGLVNNVAERGPAARGTLVTDLEMESFDAVFDMSVRVAVQAGRALIPGMVQRGYGRVINLSSVKALGGAKRTSYSAAKSAIIGITRSWALELAKSGVTVNAVAPGVIATEFFRDLSTGTSGLEQEYLADIPMGRLGRPEESAALIAFLLGDDAGYITGQTIFIDGGQSVGLQGL
jgi:NAD(P)-dependent dehydrogenase (short-subunit alcohol dehydrogenase family)